MAQLGGMKLTPSPGVAPIIRQPGAGVAPIIKQHGADVAPIIRHPGGMSYHPFVPRPASSMRTEPSPLRNTNMPNRPSMPPLSYGDNALNRKQLLEAMPVYTQTPGNHANAFKSNRNPIKDKDWDDLATEKKQRVSDKSPESVEPFAYADEAGMPPVDAVYIREYLQHQLRKLPSSTVRTVDEHAASAFELGIDCSMIAHHLHEACEATTNNETMSDEDIKVFRDEIRASLHQQCLESKLTTAEKNYLVSICSLHVAELDACRDLQELRNKVMILITRATLSASESKSTSLRPTEIIMLDNEGDKTGDQSESDSTRKMSKRLLHAMHEVLHFISEKFLCRKWNDKFVHRCFSEEVDPWQPNQKTSTSMLISVDLESADLKDALFSGKRPSADKPVRIHCKRCSGGVFEGLYECMSGFAFHTKCIHGIQDHIKRNGNTCFATSFVFFRARNPAIV
jgi:hypothetical protein